ncbi:MAG: GH36-type glycosyl hydrolase domain-containing protein [Kiloniellaceae bacterium]
MTLAVASESAAAPNQALALAAAALRARHDIARGWPEPAPAWGRLAEVVSWLDRARGCCVEAPHQAAKACEWLLDNEFHVRRAIRQVREDMPAAFYHRLPRLAAPEFRGIPRVMALAHGMLDTAHMQVSLGGAADFIKAYQQDGPLTIAELWAFPAMLRLACLEILVLAFSELLPELEAPFEPTPGLAPRESLDPTEGVSRAISALMAVSNTSWKAFFEEVSWVEGILRADPAGVYPQMDFDTRDHYRKVVEEIAAGARVNEWDVAETVLKLTRAHAGAPRRGHVGCWLVAEGRAELERTVGFRVSPGSALPRWAVAHPGIAYGAALASFTLAALAVPALLLASLDAGAWAWIAGIFLSLTPALIISVTLTHWIVTQLMPPRVLPKLDVERGLGSDCEAALVMPVIIRQESEIGPLIERLESHWLSNPDPLIHMTLLSDLADADSERTPEDAPIEAALVAGIRRLNARYADRTPFALLHRARRWNVAEGCWMGWERKRGKLEEFTAFILGYKPDAFALREGAVDALHRTRFVVTLDADTMAPPDAINRLLGALAHPLNRVEFDTKTGTPRRGYTFIQPRVEISPGAGGRSLFTRLYTGDTAIDIYSRAVSDVYQDLFGEGIFTGKGAYDVAAFHQCLHDCVPENALVSHDLFEGLHGRAALASDIVFYEDFPPNYLAYARRAHRWIRGDWQLLPWLAGSVPLRSGARAPSRLSLRDRWKILDNLRRSLIPPALVGFASVGWLVLPGSAEIWTALTVAAPGAYLFTDLVTNLARGRRRGAARSMLRQLVDHAGRWLLAIVFMAYEAVLAVDAIGRALWRVFVSRRRLLEWQSAAHAAVHLADRRVGPWAEMIAAPILASTVALALAVVDPAGLPGAAPLLLLWFASPEIARFISRPAREVAETLGSEDRIYLRQVARRTWLFFERFAGPDENWLPPDNFQESPHEEIAHRSSPTNIGMLLLSALAARDLGYIGLRDLAARTTCTLDSLDRLETYRGHTLNWFETKTLSSLEPRYVSTVDSGNLAVSLLTLLEGCREAARGPAMTPALWSGLEDSIRLLRDAASSLPAAQRMAILDRLDAILDRLPATRSAPATWRSALLEITAGDWSAIQTLVPQVLEQAKLTDPHEIHLWLERSDHHLATMRRDLDSLQPWWALVDTLPGSLGAMAQYVDALPRPDAALDGIAERITRARTALSVAAPADAGGRRWVDEMTTALDSGAAACRQLCENLESIAKRARERAFGMDFRPLYDTETRTFFIGHNLGPDRLDPHHYDLLASEARLASYFAIAKRDVPAEHWFHLGRPITAVGGTLAALSWNGSMFEYLMPALLLPSDAGRLLGQSERAAVSAQRRYGEKLGLPWGVSESGYAARDAAHRYQYQAFGVPGLGLKRGLAEDYVVAPYASALALAVAPTAAAANLRRLEKLGLRGRYGFFEAADFTPDRRPAKGGFTAVRAYMAHHQGMILAAIDNALNNGVLIKRFGSEPHMRSTELLLQERVPWEFPPEQATEAETVVPDLARSPTPVLHGWTAPMEPAPQFHVIGNGSFASWVTGAGGGALWWHDQALTRWTGDALSRRGDARLYLSDRESGAVWSLGDSAPGPSIETRFHAHKVEFHERAEGLSTSLEIVVAPADDVEIRRITLLNHSGETREIDVTSYAEVVLAPPAAHERHPAFSKLFVYSERLDGPEALIYTRRPRQLSDRPPVLVHSLLAADPAVIPAGFETDRRAFLGRHGNTERPRGATGALEGGAGWTLDPIMALRARVKLAPGARAQFAFVTAAAGSRASVLEIVQRYASAPALDWVMEDAVHSAALEARRLGIDSIALAQAQALSRDLVFPRPPAQVLAVATEAELPAQPHLWALGVSGDLPIILVRVKDLLRASLLPAVVRAHQWWQRQGLRTDLVILREGASGYQEPIRDLLVSALRAAGIPEGLGGAANVHLLAADRIGEVERRTLEAAARLSLDGAAGNLVEALATRHPTRTAPPQFQPVGPPPPEPPPAPALLRPLNCAFDNGYGGFTCDGGDYVIHLDGGRRTPAPWCNVLANETFGTIVSEAGLGFTWSINSGEHRLTSWSNDPLVDPQSEALYLRDEETAAIWTLTPLPAGGDVPCQIRHGPGATTWRRNAEGLEQRLTVFVPPEGSVKLALLSLSNAGTRGRRFTATYYAEWLLGALASMARPHLVCGYDVENRALIARNDWNPEFGGRTAFLTASRPPHSLTCDRAAFLGRQGDPARPAGLTAWSLDGALDGIADACAAFQVHIDLAPGATEEVVFVLGEGGDPAEAATLASHWSNVERVKQALVANAAAWNQRLGAVTVATPDPAFDLLVNRWLLNQTFSSRVLARAGFHQAGGAFGFRDQLQDMMALLFVEPQRVRAHILDCATRQFTEGDVLHWWHPPSGRGVRTRCSDDLLWLVYATGRYVGATGDVSILTEEAPFLSAPLLAEDEEDRYAQFEAGPERATLFEHCRRALEQGVTTGAHGLPLIGTGDWNDGMDRVGREGRGESVWLAWFAAVCADAFAELAVDVNREDLGAFWGLRAEELRRAADSAGWDGAWYARAFADDGLPWGSKDSDECQIDSISQSWAALAGGLSPQRTAAAVASATERLVDPEARLVRLLTPPFDRTPRDPGYIRAYPPGVRENGGQYTHAAAWLGLAHARLGDGDRAYEIFDLINPIRRTSSPADADLYRAEPYVLPGDVRGAGPGIGEAGWTWYTGASSWTWQLAVEGILGVSLHRGAVKISPRLPKDWGHAEVRVQGPDGSLVISIENPERLGSGRVELTVSGRPVDGDCVILPTDGSERRINARLHPIEPTKAKA